jgi:uncharacterized protein YpmB
MKKVLLVMGVAVAVIIGAGCITFEYTSKPKPPTCTQAIGDFFKSATTKEIPELTVTIQNTAIVYSLNNIDTQDRRLFCLVTPRAREIFGCQKQGDATNKCIMVDGVVFYYTTVKLTDMNDVNNKT